MFSDTACTSVRKIIRNGCIASKAGRHLFLAAALALGGCAIGAQPAQMVPEVADQPDAFAGSPLQGKIIISDVQGGEETNPILHSKVGNKELRAALQAALEKYEFLSQDKESAPYHLKVFLIELKQPMAGLSLTVTSFVRYTLIRKSDSKAVLDEVHSGSHTATIDDALGSKRMQLANEGSIRANMAAFIKSLYRYKPSQKAKPRHPIY